MLFNKFLHIFAYMKCIYLRTNLINGKQYVGQASDFKRREYDWCNLNAPYAGDYINKAREKYGLESWSVEILKECDSSEELNHWEMYFIEKFNTKKPFGYNLNDGGEGQTGFHHSIESRMRMSVSKKGKRKGIPRADDVKKKISVSKKGKRTSLGMTNHKHSSESKLKMSAAKKGKQSGAAKKVYQYLNGVLVGVYSSVKEAINANNYHYSGALSSACKGNYNNEGNHKYNGYEWYYHQL